MELILKLTIGALIATLSGHIGFYALVHITLGFMGAFAAWSATRNLFHPIYWHFSRIMPSPLCAVSTFIVLTLIPFVIVGYFGRLGIRKVGIESSIPKVVNSVLGASYGLALYIAVLCII